MSDELQSYIETLKDKDKRKIPYFFSIYGVSNNNGNSIHVPLIIASQYKKNATGANTFEDKYKQILGENKFDFILVKEYRACTHDAEPLFEISFPIKKKKKTVKKDLPVSTGLSGLDRGFEYFGGFKGFIDFRDNLNDLKNQKAIIDQRNHAIEKENSKLSNDLKKAKDNFRTLKIKYKRLVAECKKIKDKSSTTSLLVNTGLGFISNKIGLTKEKLLNYGLDLAGMSDINIDENIERNQSEKVNVKVKQINEVENKVDDLSVQMITEINNYFKELSVEELKQMYAIIDYTARFGIHDVYNFIALKINEKNKKDEIRS